MYSQYKCLYYHSTLVSIFVIFSHRESSNLTIALAWIDAI